MVNEVQHRRETVDEIIQSCKEDTRGQIKLLQDSIMNQPTEETPTMNQDRNHQHPSEAQTDMTRDSMDRHLSQPTPPQFPDLNAALQSLDKAARATGHRTEHPATAMKAMIARLGVAFPQILVSDVLETFIGSDSVQRRLLTDGSPSSWGRIWDYATRNLLVREAHDTTTNAWDKRQAAFMMCVSIHQDFNTAGLCVLDVLDAHDALRQEAKDGEA